VEGLTQKPCECLYDLETTGVKIAQISIKQCGADLGMLCNVSSEISSCNSAESMSEMENSGAIVELFETWISELIQPVSSTSHGFWVLDPCYHLNREPFISILT